MAYIHTGINQPGIVELLFYKGATGKALSDLAHTLLHGPSGLSTGDRETIAAYVSKLNDCEFCYNSHAAAASSSGKTNIENVFNICENPETSSLSEKLKALLKIAAKVQRSGREVNPDDIEFAKSQGATDEDIHDTVLIAAAFCMFNRYVDGLGTTPANKAEYKQMGKRMATKGYKYPPRFLRKFVQWLMNRKK